MFTMSSISQVVENSTLRKKVADETYEIPTKIQRMEPDKCSIHCTDDTSELVSPRDLDSWKTLARAADVRKCIFCDRASKYIKGHKTRETLMKSCELRSDSRIRDAAIKRLDDRMLAIANSGYVATEGHYHKSCYRSYTRGESEVNRGFHDVEENADDLYHRAESEALEELFSYIRNQLLPCQDILPMATLRQRFEESMSSHGVSKVNNSSRKNLRRKVEKELGQSVQICCDDNGKLLVYADSLSKNELVKKIHALRVELDAMRAQSVELVAKAALFIRNEIKENEASQTWPPDVQQDKYIIPNSVSMFLQTLLTGKTDCSQSSERTERLTNSLGSDLVYAVTGGKVKPPKHIMLPFAVKSLTGNTELIRTLNRLGHGISYTQVEEIDTALCLQKLQRCQSSVALPSNIYQGVFTTVAWDNIDRLEETISGEGTSHRVNGIVVQPRIIGPISQCETKRAEKSKTRSISTAPASLPMYNAGRRVGPSATVSQDVDADKQLKNARIKNFIWLLTQMSDPEDQTVSSWTGFNILIRNDMHVMQDTVSYLPTINAPATEMSTVNEVLTQTLNIMENLQLKEIVCVFDQALYAKAAEIVWKHEKFGNIILRMGTFHTICNLLSTIGKRFQDAGLKDLCVESGMIAEGSITAVLEGRKYNRAVRLHKIVYEALMRLAWKGFLSWIQVNHAAEVHHLEEVLRSISTLHDDVSQASFTAIMDDASCAQILQLFQDYLGFIKNSHPLAAFWMSYLDMIEIMLGLLRAAREGDWLLHLASIRAMIPWCFAYDKLNYARFLPYYYATMSRLSIDHPDVHQHFMQGGFSVQLGIQNPFGRIPVDQTVEETVNQDTQTAGGTKGFSLKRAAVERYYITSEYRSTYLKQLRSMVGREISPLNHPDLQTSRITRDEADVQSIVKLLEDDCTNPFNQNESEFVSISTATLPPPDVARDLLDAHKIGEEAYQAFKRDPLEGEITTEFHDKMTKKRLKTFSDIRKKPSASISKTVVLQADRNLFAHMVLVAQSRNLHMSDVLSHPLGPLPWALANADGTLRKTNKAVLAMELEKQVLPAETIPGPSATIIDGMSLIQKLQGNDWTFSRLAELALTQVLHEGVDSHRIDVVFDVYREDSIKNAERENRGCTTGTQFRNIAPGHQIQQWRKFLSCSANKTSLIRFLVAEWKTAKLRDKLNDKQLYVASEEACLHITKDHWSEVAGLHSNQEEADTRIILHAAHAADEGYSAVIITADDTDVLVLCLAFSSVISCPLFQKRGTTNRVRYVDITKLRQTLGDGVCNALIGMHAYTGCDTVSAFAGRGKLAALKLIKSQHWQDVFHKLGQSWKLSTDLFRKLQAFTCKLYAPSTTTEDINTARYQLFCARHGELESSQLPPCEDCLLMHAMRANYQAAIWTGSLQQHPQVPSPVEHGWTRKDDGQLIVEWMRGSPAPEAVLQLLSCKCSRRCKLPECQCMSNGLKCTDMCKLQTCSNQLQEDFEITITEADLTESDAEE